MSGKNAPHPIALSPHQEALLREVLGTPCPEALALRVRIILGAAVGDHHRQLAQRLGCSLKTVHKWRGRWRECGDLLAAAGDDRPALARALAAVLADAPRPAAAPAITVALIAQLLGASDAASP